MLFKRLILGELLTNCYIAADEDTKNAVLFDAPSDAKKIIEYLNKNDLTLTHIFLTPFHFVLLFTQYRNIILLF